MASVIITRVSHDKSFEGAMGIDCAPIEIHVANFGGCCAERERCQWCGVRRLQSTRIHISRIHVPDFRRTEWKGNGEFT